MSNLRTRLARIEHALADRRARWEAGMSHKLYEFVLKQPVGAQHAFWRVCRERHPAEFGRDDDLGRELCGGTFAVTFAVTGEDRAIFQNISDAFFGGGRGDPDPDPEPDEDGELVPA